MADKPRLRDQVRAAIRPRHYSLPYVDWIRRFIFFNGTWHPQERGGREIGQFPSTFRDVVESDVPPRTLRLSAIDVGDPNLPVEVGRVYTRPRAAAWR